MIGHIFVSVAIVIEVPPMILGILKVPLALMIVDYVLVFWL